MNDELLSGDLMQNVIVGAQVTKSENGRRKRRKSRKIVLAGQVSPTSDQSRQTGKPKDTPRPLVSILTDPILVGSNITWGHVLIILTAGAFLLLMVDRLKKK